MTRAFATAALLAAAIIPAAHAAAPKEVVVAYGDLDLATPAGQFTLKMRLEGAAAQTCSPILTPPDSDQGAHEQMVVYRACIGRHVERAMAQVETGRN